MIPFVNDSVNQLPKADAALGTTVGQLFSPHSRRHLVDPQRALQVGFGVDNGCYIGFRQGDTIGTFPYLVRELLPHRALCRFVTVPDAYGCAVETRALFDARSDLFPYLAGWPLAYAAQPGANGTVPWSAIRALFVGGDDHWQMSRECAAVVRAAKIRNLWVHVGRVNEESRIAHFLNLGADSFDGLAATGRGRDEQKDRMRAALHQGAVTDAA